MNIFFDFDGTLVDISRRYYQIYSELLIGAGYPVLDIKKYWDMKRNKYKEEDILCMTDAGEFFPVYNKRRSGLIEISEYLSLDVLHGNVPELLKKLSSSSNLVIVTLRERHDNLIRQLGEFNIAGYFDEILTPAENVAPRWKMKYLLILNYLSGRSHSITNAFVTDTETDLITARKLDFISLAVLNGIRCRSILEKYKPDYILESVDELSGLNLN